VHLQPEPEKKSRAGHLQPETRSRAGHLQPETKSRAGHLQPGTRTGAGHLQPGTRSQTSLPAEARSVAIGYLGLRAEIV